MIKSEVKCKVDSVLRCRAEIFIPVDYYVTADPIKAPKSMIGFFFFKRKFKSRAKPLTRFASGNHSNFDSSFEGKLN